MLAAALTSGCAATSVRPLMPTPALYLHEQGARALFASTPPKRRTADVELLYITDRASETDPDSGMPYGEGRSRSLAFGTASVRSVPSLSWPELERQSLLSERTRDLSLELGTIKELGRFPREPYAVVVKGDGVVRSPDAVERHRRAKAGFEAEEQEQFKKWGLLDLVVYKGKRTDTYGHSYFISNPRVSSDLIQTIRYGTKPGDPGRSLEQIGPITWTFPGEEAASGGR